MLTAVAASLAVVLAVALAVIVARRREARAARGHAAILRRIDEHLEPVSVALEEALERAEKARLEGSSETASPNVERLLERIAAEGAPANAFRRLAEEVAPELRDEHRLPRAKQPAERDQLTGVRSRSGYEAELEREIGRARRTGRPLSLVLLDLAHPRDTAPRVVPAGDDRVLREFASLLVRVTRVTDTVCRRRGEEFGILLPETTATGARHFHRRLHEEAARTTSPRHGQVTFASGIVEWRPDESGEALDARAHTAVGRSLVRSLEPPEDTDDPGGDALGTPGSR